MKTTCLAICVLFSLFAFSQEKGVSPIHQQSTNSHQQTYAVVVGISDYQNDDIPDLRFAHKDAAAFAEYLKSPAGGNLNDEQLKMLLNENATTAQIAAALEWLVEVSEEGDRAIIYFSGHGDVETKTMFQLGYLLTWDSPARTYVAGAFPLQYLQAVVSTLSVQNKVEVALITDACRAGKLAGNTVGGAQITNSNLSKQFANEVKILSCQPDEFSLEGEQWGGGRGVFSYHLLDGLYGLADNNADQTVNLFEIGRYLEDKVSGETSPHSQFPMIVGSKNTPMAQVDEASLAQLKERRSKETPILATVEFKGFEDMILTEVDSVWQQKYQQFVAAVDEGRLLDSPTEEPAAYDLYLELQKAIELKKLHGTMQRNLAAALQDDAQQAINAYLEANPAELAKRYETESDYERYPRYLRKAAEILGEKNFYYPYVMAKLYYFEGLQMRLDADKEVENASYEKAIEFQKKALEFQEYAPFVLNELGVLHTKLKLDDKAFEYYEKSIELAPQWGIPYSNYAVGLFYVGEYEKALEYGEKALDYLPDFPQMYTFLAWMYANESDWSDKKDWPRRGLELAEGITFSENSVHTSGQLKVRYQKAIELLEKAAKIDTANFYTYNNLGTIYQQINEPEKGVAALLKAIRIDSTKALTYFWLGRLYLRLNKTQEGKEALYTYIRLVESNRDKSTGYNSLQWAYRQEGNTQKAIELLKEAIIYAPQNPFPYTNLCGTYIAAGNLTESEKIILKGISENDAFPLTYAYLVECYGKLNRVEELEYFKEKGLGMKPDLVRLYESLLEYYLERGNIKKADETYKKLEELSPEDPSVLRTIGFFYRVQSMNEQAEKVLKKGFEQDENLFWGLAWVYFDTDRKQQAYTLLDSMIQINPQEIRPYYQKALFQIYDDQWEQSKATLRQLVQLNPKYESLLSAINHFQQNDFERSTPAFEQAINSFPGADNIQYLFCRQKIKEGKIDEALDLLESALKIKGRTYNFMMNDPHLAPLHSSRRFQKLMRKHFPSKYDDLEDFGIKHEPIYDLENCVRLANYYLKIGEFKRADRLYKKAIEIKPTELTKEEAIFLAQAYLLKNDWENAQKICPKNISSDDAEENFTYGEIYYKLNRFEKAEMHFQKNLQLSKDPAKAVRIGFHYYQNSDIALAEKYLDMEIKTRPNIGPYIGISLSHFASGDYKKAIRIIEEGIERFPNVYLLKSTKAFILAYSDTPKTGMAAFAKLESLQPGSAKIGTFLKLITDENYEAADKVYHEIMEELPRQSIPMINIAYIRMLVAQKDFSAAMKIIEENAFFVFTYGLLTNDPALAPLRKTEAFKTYMQRNFPGKMRE